MWESMNKKLLILDTNGMIGKTYNIDDLMRLRKCEHILLENSEDWFSDDMITKWIDRDFNNGNPLMYPRHADFKFFFYTQTK